MKRHRNIRKFNLVLVALFCFIAIAVVGAVFGQTALVARPTHPAVLAATRSTVTYVASQVFTQDGTSYGQGNWFGTAGNAGNSYTGIRFEGISVPKGAAIENAVLQVTSSNEQWIAQSTTVYAETSETQEAFSASNPPSNRTKSTQSLGFSDNKKWTKGTPYEFPSLLQIVPAMSMTSRSTVSLILKGGGNSWGRKFINGTESQASAPKLIVTYSTDSSSPVPSPAATVQPTAQPTATPGASIVPKNPEGSLPPPTQTPGATGGNSFAMGTWIPSKWDTCPAAFHDSFSVIGPDGKRYPTWHPPTAINPATGKMCTFGHEHGRDPKGSRLYAWIQQQNAYDANRNGKIESEETEASGIPFGYANEQLDVYNTANGIANGMRHEDHAGFKIMWENQVQRDQSQVAGGSNRKPVDLYCDMLMAQHQGTHSKDAFTNNVHATQYYIDCNKGSLVSQYPVKLALQFMSVFGKAGGFSEGGFDGGFKFISVGIPSPANSPSAGEPGRSLPTITRVKDSVLVPEGQFSQFSLGLYEDWISGSHLMSSDGRELVYVDPHFAVFSPSRFYDPSQPDNVGRSIDVCYMKEANGDRARGGECDEVTNYKDGSTIPESQRIPYDDPRSPFNGCTREFYFNNNAISNAGGPTYWYTDPYGKNGKTSPFPGSIRQYIPSAKTSLPFNLESIAIGKDMNWCGTGVHAPN
ncbi:MAG: hypothetical protein ABI758_00785 [Candidatus Woesebacteria bacterium]